MSLEANKNLVARMTKTLLMGDLSQLEEFFAPDVRFHNTLRPNPDEGIETARKSLSGFRTAFPDMAVTILEQYAEGDRVVTIFELSGTMTGEWLGKPASHRSFRIKCASVSRVADGKIVEHWNYDDNFGMLFQLGRITLTP